MMQDVAQQATGRIITLHLSPYHAIQGTEEYVRRVMGRRPFHMDPQVLRCRECQAAIGNFHYPECRLSGHQPMIVDAADVDRQLAVTPVLKSRR